jgi:hypothetical protein
MLKNFQWWRYGWSLLLATGTIAMATPIPVRVWTEVTTQSDLWTVVPHVEASPGRALDYEILAKKSGRSGTSNTSQSGKLTVGAEGSSALATLSIGVGSEDRCDVEIKVFEDSEVVGTIKLRLPL